MRIGFLSLLTIVFIILKLTEVIAWSWVWVLSPLWLGIPVAVVFFLTLVVLIELINQKSRDRTRKSLFIRKGNF